MSRCRHPFSVRLASERAPLHLWRCTTRRWLSGSVSADFSSAAMALKRARPSVLKLGASSAYRSCRLMASQATQAASTCWRRSSLLFASRLIMLRARKRDVPKALDASCLAEERADTTVRGSASSKRARASSCSERSSAMSPSRSVQNLELNVRFFPFRERTRNRNHSSQRPTAELRGDRPDSFRWRAGNGAKPWDSLR
jgi:hypothetical protein